MGAYYGLGLGLGGAPVPIRGSHLAVGELIEQFPGAAAAYSLRPLRNNASNVVRVRRESDNAERDFTAQDITSGEMVNWVGAGNNGFVETWYDQSGNGNDATQLVAANQPKIVNGGTLNADGIDFDGVNDNLLSSSHILSADDVLSLYTVAKCDDTSQRGRLVGDLFFNSGGDNGGFGLDIKAANLPTAIATYGDDGLNSHFDLADVTQGAIQLFELQLAGGSSDFLINGTVESTISTGMNSEDGGKTLIIGATSSTGDNPFIGNIKEIVIYNSDQTDNRAAIATNINNHYDIYS